MTKTKNIYILGTIIALFLTVMFTMSVLQVKADVTTQQMATPGQFKTYTFFATSTAQTSFATTTTATSTNITPWTNTSGTIDNGYFVIAGAKKVTFYFKRGDTTGQGNSGSTNYRIQVANKPAPTESDWYYYNKLVQNVATSTVFTTLSSDTITAATSTVIDSMQMDNDAFFAVRCIAVETTDGEHSCSASAQY